MNFKKPANEIIRDRYSCRRYETKPIDSGKKDELEKILNKKHESPFNSEIRFQLISTKDDDSGELKGLGTYGTIKNPAGYIAGAVSDSDNAMVDFGYAMEKIILHATDLELGTCWLGGTFRRSSFAGRISLKKNEIMPAVTTLGNILKKPAMKDGGVISPRPRKEWDEIFFENNFTTALTEIDAGDYKDVLEMVRLAPSASNKQPWRILKDKNINTYHFFLTRNKGYTRTLKFLKLADLQRLDIGIAMCHFELAAEESGLKGTWEKTSSSAKINKKEFEYIASWTGK